MMDRDDLELFERSVRAAVEADDVDAALEELGWADAYEDDPQVAVSVLFQLQGEACARSRALEAVAGSDVLPMGSTAVRFGHVPGGGIDPSYGLVEVAEGADLPADRERLARLAVSHELMGASRRMLALAREHALERIQFDQPIARFQAVRHKLAEVLIAIETAEAVVEAAWIDGSPATAAMAKAMAGRGARTAAKHCQQVCAGIGFTTEHDLHRYIRRVYVLDELLGAGRTLTKQLGDDVLRTRRLPDLLPL
jgi:alkylation response protein AidB-like acyl-CoA dehydrogenase